MKVISYSIFRTANGRPGDYFWKRLPSVLRAAFALFPEWTIVIHHDDTFAAEPYAAVLHQLQRTSQVQLVDCGRATRLAEAMLWRLKPLFGPGVTYLLSRDTDSLASPRERWAVEAFLRSGRAMHLLNDSPSHQTVGTPPFMLGGMVGFDVTRFLAVTKLRSWDAFINFGEAQRSSINLDGYGGDQDVLNCMLHPLLQGDYLQATFVDGHAIIKPEPLTVEIDPQAMAGSPAEYIGHVFNDVAGAFAWLDALPTSAVIRQAELEVGRKL
jgi:hypothetical protein